MIAGFALGPRPHASLDGPTVAPPRSPLAAAKALAAREGAEPDLTPGAEARVVWAGDEGAVTDWSVLYLHGFSATRQETAPVAARVAEGLGANLVEARMTGHGLPGDRLGRATVQDWLRDTRETLALARAAGRRTLVIACSTGATLATAVEVTDQPEGVVYAFLSPNYALKDPSGRLLTWPWARTWIPWVVGEERAWTPTSDGHAKYWTHRYPVAALFELAALLAAVEDADLSAFDAPLLVLLSDEDPTVDPAVTRDVLARMGTEAKVIEVRGAGSHHVIAGDIRAPGRTEAVVQDILRFVSGTSAPGP